MPLDDLIATRLGARTRAVENRDVSSIGTSIVEILPNDPNRLSATIINLSTNILYVSPGRDPSTAKGIRISPNGGSLVIVWDEDFHVTGYAWYAVADGAASAVYTLEEVEY